MAELGNLLYIGSSTPYITRADGYAPPDGYSGYSYEYYSTSLTSQDSDFGNTTGAGAYIDYAALPTPSPGGAIIYYVMRGRDVDCGTVTYRTWTVSGNPDTTGSQYLGAKCGANPLTDIVVVHKYTG